MGSVLWSSSELEVKTWHFGNLLPFKGEVNPIFLFHHWVRIGQTKTSFNRQFSPKRPEVGQIFILRSNFDQNKDHMTSKQVRGPSKNWHPASEGTLKTDIVQVRGPYFDIQQVRGRYFIANKDLSWFTHFLEIFGQKKCLFVEQKKMTLLPL